jgi:hypothetical protein
MLSSLNTATEAVKSVSIAVSPDMTCTVGQRRQGETMSRPSNIDRMICTLAAYRWAPGLGKRHRLSKPRAGREVLISLFQGAVCLFYFVWIYSFLNVLMFL